MKANELMIGDWVFFKNGKVLETRQITVIGNATQNRNNIGKCVCLNMSDEFPTCIFEIDEISPIPLTPEILEKNGFDTSDPEVKQYHFTEDGQSYHFSLRQMYNQKDNKPNGYSFYAFGVLTIIDYVHQLQHALRLCGIEKEIVV